MNILSKEVLFILILLVITPSVVCNGPFNGNGIPPPYQPPNGYPARQQADPENYYEYSYQSLQTKENPPQSGILAKLRNSITSLGAASTPKSSSYSPQGRNDFSGVAPYPYGDLMDNRAPRTSAPTQRTDQWEAGPYTNRLSPYDTRYSEYYTPQSAASNSGGIVGSIDSSARSVWSKFRNLITAANGAPQSSPYVASAPYTPPGYSPHQSPVSELNQRFNQGANSRSQPPFSEERYPRKHMEPSAYIPGRPQQNAIDETRGKRDQSADSISTPLADMYSQPFPRGSDSNNRYEPRSNANSFSTPYTVPIGASSTDKGQFVVDKGIRQSFDHLPSEVATAEAEVPPEPQLLVMERCVVLIPRPREYTKKKLEIIRAGSQQLHVFADFERTLTTFKAPNGELSYSTMELLETSNALFPEAAARIRSIVQEYEAAYPSEMDHTLYIEMMGKIQDTIAKEGGLHMSYVAPATRAMQDRIALRDGWREALEALSMRRIPTYIFSSGYGDIIVQLLLQQGYFGGRIPPNIRIVSNFFRAAPDGSVKGFSKPIVHPGNKNATTASLQMDMPLPERQYALVFGSEVEDVKMASDAPGIKDTLSVGFLEMTEDLSARLPGFLKSYDAVVLGDGSFRYCKSLIEELLRVNNFPGPDSGAKQPDNILDSSSSARRSNVDQFPGRSGSVIGNAPGEINSQRNTFLSLINDF